MSHIYTGWYLTWCRRCRAYTAHNHLASGGYVCLRCDERQREPAPQPPRAAWAGFDGDSGSQAYTREAAA